MCENIKNGGELNQDTIKNIVKQYLTDSIKSIKNPSVLFFEYEEVLLKLTDSMLENYSHTPSMSQIKKWMNTL